MDSDPLGIFSSLVLQRRDLKVSAGDRVYLYTDGLIESSPGGGRQTGLEALVEACVLHRTDSLKAGTALITADIQAKVGTINDDLLLLSIEVHG